MQADQQLSPHFHLSEFTQSQTAVRLGLRNEPLSLQIANLRRVALVLEQVRRALGDVPILVSSGFRTPELNRLVRGAKTSAHQDGRAADFTAPAFGSPREICQCLIDQDVVCDQLIWEGTWVHLGIASLNAAPRREVLTARFQPDCRVLYTPGLG
jgi:hypothetical protein